MLESLQAIGVDVWVPVSQTCSEPKVYQFGLMSSLVPSPHLIILSAQDQQNWSTLEELLAGILRWLKIVPGSYNLAFLNQAEGPRYELNELIAKSEAKQILSFGVPLRLILDSHPGIRYFETLPLFRVINNVENKRQVMNDFAGFSL